MSLYKGWQLISLITGLITLIPLWLAYSLLGSIESGMGRMMVRLTELHEPVGQYYSPSDAAGLFILTFVVTMILCGTVATLISRPSGISLLNAQAVPLLAALIPVFAIDLFLIITYVNNTREYYQDNFGPGPYYPTEPPFLPVYLSIMAFITLTGLIVSGAGGVMAWWALNSDKS